MKRHQILQNLFGDQSDEEEVASSHDLNQHPNFLSNEKDEGSELENKSISENQQGAKLESGTELNDEARSSRSTETEKDKDQVLLSAVIRDVFGDSDDDEQAKYGVQDGTDQGENDCRSPEHKVNYEKELKCKGIVSDEDTPYVSEEEKTEAKIKEKAVCNLLVLEIPLRTPLAHSSQMATIKVSNLIGIDPKPFDPTTYVEEDFYVTDASGSERLIPPTNIIRWRNVLNADGTTSVESNARFVTWSDGSLQLLIGDEAFDVSEEDAEEIQSHVFVRHTEGIYQAQGKISKKMKFMPSSLSSNSHCVFTALVDSQDKKVHKVRHCITDVDPERVMEQPEKAERQTTEDNEQLNQKKKKTAGKCNPKDSKEHQVSASFVEDVIDEGPKYPHQAA